MSRLRDLNKRIQLRFCRKHQLRLCRLNQSGQIAVEYVLLLVVGIGIYIAIVQGLVSRNAESPGVIIRKWREIIEFIAKDRVENEGVGEE